MRESRRDLGLPGMWVLQLGLEARCLRLDSDDMDSPSEAPIFVIGTHRSGTTLLGRALAHHPDVAYWEEPRHIWSRGNNFKPDDVLTAAEATAKVKARVRRAFERYVAADRRAWTPEAQFIGPRLLGTPFWEWPALIPRAWRTLGRKLFAGEMAFWGPQLPGWRDWLGQDPRIVVSGQAVAIHGRAGARFPGPSACRAMARCALRRAGPKAPGACPRDPAFRSADAELRV